MTKKMRTYTELIKFPDYEGRLNYLRLHGEVGKETFGYDRYLNQMLYRYPEWKKVRRDVILRDKACDLGISDREIYPSGHKKMIFVHHMNPITKEDILERSELVLNPEYLITVSFDTHQIIHYGYSEKTVPTLVERKPFDTCPWRN